MVEDLRDNLFEARTNEALLPRAVFSFEGRRIVRAGFFGGFIGGPGKVDAAVIKDC